MKCVAKMFVIATSLNVINCTAITSYKNCSLLRFSLFSKWRKNNTRDQCGNTPSCISHSVLRRSSLELSRKLPPHERKEDCVTSQNAVCAEATSQALPDFFTFVLVQTTNNSGTFIYPIYNSNTTTKVLTFVTKLVGKLKPTYTT